MQVRTEKSLRNEKATPLVIFRTVETAHGTVEVEMKEVDGPWVRLVLVNPDGNVGFVFGTNTYKKVGTLHVGDDKVVWLQENE